jgi:hypothetical protein
VCYASGQMRLLIITTLYFFTTVLYGQTKDNLVLTQEQNDKWFESFGQLKLDKQLEALNKRLLADTNIFVPTNFELLEKVQLNGRQVGFCKPLMVAGGVQISIENRTRTEEVKQLTSLLTTRTVKKIEVITGDKATALLGSRGVCNGIIITIMGKRTKRKLEKLADDMYPSIKEIRWRH